MNLAHPPAADKSTRTAFDTGPSCCNSSLVFCSVLVGLGLSNGGSVATIEKIVPVSCGLFHYQSL